MNNFTGTGVAIVTPFNTDYSIDFNSLTNLVEFLIKGGVDYLVVLGTTGESATLSKEEKQQVINHVKSVNNNRLPLVVGIGGNNTHAVISDIQSFDISGYQAILSVSPYYNKPTQEGIYQHYKAIAEASPLPIILYNVPGRTNSNVLASTTLRLANDFKNIIAVKEASGSLEQCMEIIQNKPANFLVISGDDNLTLPILAAGGNGVISVIANACPSVFSKMVNAGLKNDMPTARNEHYKVFSITQSIFKEGNPAGVKELLQHFKIMNNVVRLPLVNVSNQLSQEIKSLASEHDLFPTA